MPMGARTGLTRTPNRVPVYTRPIRTKSPQETTGIPKLGYAEVFDYDTSTGRLAVVFSDGQRVEVETEASRSQIVALEVLPDGDLVVRFREGPSQNLGPLVGLDARLTEIAEEVRWTTYRHVQDFPQTVWTIVHGLGCRPSITAVDSAGREVEGAVEYVSDDEVVITFSSSFGGEAYLN